MYRNIIGGYGAAKQSNAPSVHLGRKPWSNTWWNIKSPNQGILIWNNVLNVEEQTISTSSFVTMNISGFLASEVSPTQKPSWRASEPPVQGQRRPTVLGFPTSSSQSIEPLGYGFHLRMVWQWFSISLMIAKKSQCVLYSNTNRCLLTRLGAMPQTLLQHVTGARSKKQTTTTISSDRVVLCWCCSMLRLYVFFYPEKIPSWTLCPPVVLSCGLSLPTGQLVSLRVIFTKKSQRNFIDHHL